MGAGLPSAIAAKLVFPSRAVVAIAGDGGFMMNSQELETAMRLKLNLVVITLLDEHYGMVQWKQRNRNLSEFGLAFGNRTSSNTPRPIDSFNTSSWMAR
jgi:acetolactate synthase-1/2/3 large subunit